MHDHPREGGWRGLELALVFPRSLQQSFLQRPILLTVPSTASGSLIQSFPDFINPLGDVTKSKTLFSLMTPLPTFCHAQLSLDHLVAVGTPTSVVLKVWPLDQ